MAKDIKSDILDIAKEMFNTSGYNDISMRNIADALGISVGNLTYHFKKKEDIIYAIIMEQYKNFKKKPVTENLSELNIMFKKMECRQQKSAHYFKHYTQLSQAYPDVAEIQLSIMVENYKSLLESLKHLQKNGYIKEEEFKGQLEALVHCIMTISTYGIQHLERTKKGGLEYSRTRSLWSMLYFMLTESGMEYFKKEIESELV